MTASTGPERLGGVPDDPPARHRLLLIAALGAGPLATVAASIIAYDADWTRVQAHDSELLLGLVPAAFAAVALLAPALLARRAALLGGGLLLLVSLISSAGLFWLPTAILLIVAGRAAHGADHRAAGDG